MMVTEKKQYTTPQAKTVEFNSDTLLAGSDLTGGGDNDIDGAPTTAEGKSIDFLGRYDEEE